ncbi:MAG: cation:dicarboxylase symporter family transporter, partial [Pseudohongiellaceae bacterium]
DAIGMAPEQIGLVIGFIFAIDRPLDMLRTSVNIAGDLSVSTAVANWEGEFDADRFNRLLEDSSSVSVDSSAAET